MLLERYSYCRNAKTVTHLTQARGNFLISVEISLVLKIMKYSVFDQFLRTNMIFIGLLCLDCKFFDEYCAEFIENSKAKSRKQTNFAELPML